MHVDARMVVASLAPLDAALSKPHHSKNMPPHKCWYCELHGILNLSGFHFELTLVHPKCINLFAGPESQTPPARCLSPEPKTLLQKWEIFSQSRWLGDWTLVCTQVYTLRR